MLRDVEMKRRVLFCTKFAGGEIVKPVVASRGFAICTHVSHLLRLSRSVFR